MNRELANTRNRLFERLKTILTEEGYELMGKVGGDITITFGKRQPCANYGFIRIDIEVDKHDLVKNEYLEGDEYKLKYKRDNSACYPDGGPPEFGE